MARQPKAENNIQVFRGSLPRQDVFSQNASDGCCAPGTVVTYDKLGPRVRFDNALAHSNPTGANDKINLPDTGYDADRAAIIDTINAHGVGTTISGLVIPTYAFVTGVAVTIYAEEEGLTFDVVTRNGLELPAGQLISVTATGTGCEVERTQSDGPAGLNGFGALDEGVLYQILIVRDGDGTFSLEADEIMLRVASMPASGRVSGTFRVELAVSYDVIKRAEA